MNVQEFREDETLSGSVIWALFNRTHFAVYRLRELELAQFNLTVEQTGILILLLSRGGSATAKTIEDLTMRQHHSISTLVNRMIKTNLVAKRKSPNGKTSEIVITKDGEDLYKSVLTNSMEMVFSSIKAKDRKQLLEYLTLILEKARDLLGVSYIPPFLRYRQIENRTQEIKVKNKEDKKTTDQEIWKQLNLAWSALYRLRELELAQFSLTV